MTSSSHSSRYGAERPLLNEALAIWRADLGELAKRVDRAAFIDGRVKTLRSVIGKIYAKPAQPRSWESLGDLVALKAIFPTSDGVEAFTNLLLEHEDWHPKLDDRRPLADKLEYAAKQFDLWRHDVVDSTGNPVKTEVQVRTAAADAWYVVDHRLNYKGLVELPENLRRKVLRLSVFAELFDEEVRAIFDARASLDEYLLARAYDFLTLQIDDMTDGLATASRPEALLETILSAYTDAEASELQRIIDDFLGLHRAAVASVISGHQHDANDFVEERDRLYSEPEALLIAERAVARPALLKSAVKGSDYETLVGAMARAFEGAVRGVGA